MARRRRRTVYGEPVEVLLEVLTALDHGDDQQADEDAGPVLSDLQRDALVRAVMRSEAALLRKDADRFPSLDRPVGERRSVAMLLLAVDVIRTSRRFDLAVPTTMSRTADADRGGPPAERAVS